MVIEGKEYTLLATIPCKQEMTLVDPQFEQYFAGGAEAGLKAITDAGNVYVNGDRIPYIMADGTVSREKLAVNGEDAIWPVDGGWAWKTHKQRNWDEKFFLPRLEAAIGYTLRQPVTLSTAAYLFTKYLAHIGGQTIELWAAPGEKTASVVTTRFLMGTFISAVERNGDSVSFLNADGEPLGFTAKAANVAPDVAPGCMIIIWEDAVTGWNVRRAASVQGRFHPDPTNPRWPLFRPTGAAEDLHYGEAMIAKRFHEGMRPTQFQRGQRRLDQNNADTDVVLWCIDDKEWRLNGVTRANPRAGLQHGVAYAETQTANIAVSADGSDVPASRLWVTPETWNAYQEKLAECKAALADEKTENFRFDKLIIELANVYGGTEDLHSHGPMKMNPLGVIGTAQPGTKA